MGFTFIQSCTHLFSFALMHWGILPPYCVAYMSHTMCSSSTDFQNMSGVVLMAHVTQDVSPTDRLSKQTSKHMSTCVLNHTTCGCTTHPELSTCDQLGFLVHRWRYVALLFEPPPHPPKKKKETDKQVVTHPSCDQPHVVFHRSPACFASGRWRAGPLLPPGPPSWQGWRWRPEAEKWDPFRDPMSLGGP